jgi:hypothetical protein
MSSQEVAVSEGSSQDSRGLQDLLGYGDAPKEEVVFGVGSDRGSGNSEGEDEDDDTASRASSAYSLDHAGVDLRSYVDLTQGGLYCLVKMSRPDGRRLIPCVCGYLKTTCRRKGHKDMRRKGDPATLGSPGFYEPLRSSSSKQGPDGRLDRRWYTPEEGQAMLNDKQAERDAISKTNIRSTVHLSPGWVDV